MVMFGLLLHLLLVVWFMSMCFQQLKWVLSWSDFRWGEMIIFGSLLDLVVSGLVHVNVFSTIKFNSVWFRCKIISTACCPQAGSTNTRGESRMLGWVVNQWWELVTDKFPALTFLRSVQRENFSTLIYVHCPMSIVQCDDKCVSIKKSCVSGLIPSLIWAILE